MIYTVTFNPALDYVMNVADFSVGKIHYAESEHIYCGGKGINVSQILNQLDVQSVALGFIAGFVGDKIEAELNKQGIKTDFVRLKNGMSRINVKVRSGAETDINATGPDIDGAALSELFSKLDSLETGDILIVSGSVPKCLPDNVYENILNRVDGKGVLTVVDASGDRLLNTLKYHPFLIKPNNDELAEIFGKSVTSLDEITDCANRLQQAGAKNVLVSMGKDGSVLFCEDGNVLCADSVGGTAVNTVGAGDSMGAGFVAGYIKTRDFAYALKLGTAAGSATALSEGLATADKINELMELRQPPDIGGFKLNQNSFFAFSESIILRSSSVRSNSMNDFISSKGDHIG